MIITKTKQAAIRNVMFIGNYIMFVYLDNDRTFIIPLNKFPDIANLTDEQRNDFEIIDNHYLSFLAIDNIYSIYDLAGLNIE